MGISFGSINTGLPKDIVQQIINAEKIPIQNMEARKEKVTAKQDLVKKLIQLVEDVRGTLAKNANARSLREFKVNTNDDLVKVEVDKNVTDPGNYQVEVVQLAQKSSAMTSGFADKDKSYVGVGYIRYNLPNGESREIYVDSNHSSLSDIAKLINADAGNGMRANVVNDGSESDTPWRLIISLDQTGDGQRAEFPYFYFVDGEDDFYIEFERKAQDAKIKLDGFEIEVPENKVKDLIPGVTLDLKKAKPGEEFSINISENSEAITDKVSELVQKINGVLAFIKEQNSLDEKTDTSKTLGGDIVLTTLESRIRGAVFRDVMTDFGPKRFGDLGVTFQRDGSLTLDTQKFNAVAAKDYKLVSQILRGRFSLEGGKIQGFMDYLDDAINQVLLIPNGMLHGRKNSLQSEINQIDRQIHDKQRMITQKENNLKQKFARLEGTIAKIKSSSAGLNAIASTMPNPVQQLG